MRAGTGGRDERKRRRGRKREKGVGGKDSISKGLALLLHKVSLDCGMTGRFSRLSELQI